MARYTTIENSDASHTRLVTYGVNRYELQHYDKDGMQRFPLDARETLIILKALPPEWLAKALIEGGSALVEGISALVRADLVRTLGGHDNPFFALDELPPQPDAPCALPAQPPAPRPSLRVVTPPPGTVDLRSEDTPRAIQRLREVLTTPEACTVTGECQGTCTGPLQCGAGDEEPQP